MKVIRNTTNQLIVEQRPWLLGIGRGAAVLVSVAIGLNMVVAGDLSGLWFIVGATMSLMFMFIFVRRVQVVFHRPEGWVEIRRQNLRGRSTVRHSLSEISGVTVDTSNSGDTPTHRVVLHIPEGQSAGEHPLTHYYTSGRGSKRAAKAINDWLN